MLSARSSDAQSPLREARQKKGVGLRALADTVGVDPTHLSRVERGLAKPSVELVVKLVQALKLGDRAMASIMRGVVGDD